jgi:HK97 family phage major capsid protein
MLKQLRLQKLITQRRDAEKKMQEMLKMIETAEKEKRNFSPEENKRFSSLEKEIENLDAEFEKEGVTMEEAIEQLDDIKTRANLTKGNTTNTSEYRAMKRRMDNPNEVRGYRGKERIGRYDTDVTVGDLIVSHITGKYRSSEVREAMNTTGTGNLVIPANIFSNYIDRLRDNSILGEVTTYPMDSKTLTIPRVVSDIVPEFKIENELAKETSPIFSSLVLEAKPLYAFCPISLELVEASNLDMGQVITDLMAKAMGDAMQKFMLYGAVNGYEGVINQVGAMRTGNVDYATIGSAMGAIKYNRGVPNSIVMNSQDALDLQLLQDSTGQYIQQPEFMNELKRFEMSGETLVQGTALLGDLSSIAFGVLSQGGLQIEISRTAGEAFQRGQIVVRARINGDFALTNAGLLAKILPSA